jgi:hypothetical protein
MAPFAHPMASTGLVDQRAMGTDAMTEDHTMKVKTHVRAGAVPIAPPAGGGGGRCGA